MGESKHKYSSPLLWVLIFFICMHSKRWIYQIIRSSSAFYVLIYLNRLNSDQKKLPNSKPKHVSVSEFFQNTLHPHHIQSYVHAWPISYRLIDMTQNLKNVHCWGKFWLYLLFSFDQSLYVYQVRILDD